MMCIYAALYACLNVFMFMMSVFTYLLQLKRFACLTASALPDHLQPHIAVLSEFLVVAGGQAFGCQPIACSAVIVLNDVCGNRTFADVRSWRQKPRF